MARRSHEHNPVVGEWVISRNFGQASNVANSLGDRKFTVGVLN